VRRFEEDDQFIGGITQNTGSSRSSSRAGVSESIQLKFKLIKNKTFFTSMFISVQQQC